MSKLASVRNPDGLWINTSLFREAANHFIKYGYYCPDPWGSPAWFEYWTEERKRCIQGYSIGSAKITGDHYFYLNFCPILKVKDTSSSKSVKVKSFPDFWDGDYNYFWVREIARHGIFDALGENEEKREAHIKLDSQAQALELKLLFESLHLEVRIEPDYLRGGWNLIVGKARRRGYSYKSAGTATNNYFTKPGSYNFFGAYEKKFLYPKGVFSMAVDNISFINSHTGWAMPSDVVQKQDHIKASYIEYKNGIKIEEGFKSEIQALTFKDNADAGRGKDVYDGWLEESGAFGTPDLLKRTYAALQDTVMAGAIKTGMLTIFGTSGDLDGGSMDYAEMHTKPAAFGLLPFVNIWDEDSEDIKCGFFHPINWNMEGYYDKEGNSDKASAKTKEMEERAAMIAAGATSLELNRRLQEKPLGPREAFGAVSLNNFPVVELNRRLQIVRAKGYQESKGTPVNLIYDGEKTIVEPILDGTATPITSYSHVPKNKKGCPIIYEYPVKNPPPGLYKIGYDPVRQDQGTSLASIVVYKGVHIGSYLKMAIVAEYVGRMETPEDMDFIAEKFAVLYNAKIMFENEVVGTRNYFRRRKKLHLLAVQPDAVISKNILDSKVTRVLGCHMTPQLKDAGERYAQEWFMTILDYAEDGTAVSTIDQINSIRFLEEAIKYNRKGNFDYMSAFFMVMIQAQEEVLGRVYEEHKPNPKVKKLLAMMDNMYKRN